MRLSFIILAISTFTQFLCAQVEVVRDPIPTGIFADVSQKIHVTFHNDEKRSAEIDLRFRLYQASSGTLMPVGDIQTFKRIKILEGQTVIETVSLKIPAIKTSGRFQVQWFDGDKKFGVSDVMVYPVGILKQLKVLAGEKALGILDVSGELRKLLDQLKIEYEDLEKDPGLGEFNGKLVIITAYTSKEQLPPQLIANIGKKAKDGASIVWVRPADMAQPMHQVTVCSLQMGEGTVVMVHPSVVVNIGSSADAQVALIRCAQMAVKPMELP